MSDKPMMTAEATSEMAAAGVPENHHETALAAAGLLGISLTDFLALAMKYAPVLGPALWQFIQDLVAKINPPKPA